jgi:hypothetical protein
VQECSQAGSHNGSQFGPSTRPKQLRDREVSWEGSHRSKLMSRRTERPYKVDGAGELAPHSAARRSAPEINGPVVQQEFTFLLRETCRPSPPATVGAVARNGCRAGTGVSRGRSTEGNEPGKTGWTHNSGRAELGRQTRPPAVLSRSDEADRLSVRAAISVAEKEWLLHPQGLSGTAVRGPACTVVWERGGATLPATRFSGSGPLADDNVVFKLSIDRPSPITKLSQRR